MVEENVREIKIVTETPHFFRPVSAILSPDRFVFTGLHILNVSRYIAELMDGAANLSNGGIV